MLGVKVLNENEPEPGVEREMLEQLGEGLQSASGSTDPDDGEGGPGRG